MDKYEVIGTLGEGSFGRVYKAKQLSSDSFVALKVISKRGRSVKELKGFRRECEIQRDLHHPNVIQMLDSFETENEIVVITEFAPKELTGVLCKEGYLNEEKVQQIVWDLVSALYYLHSNRVLHRDLKPQNILLDLKNRAKLCDFGFARNMSTGTHVLTSIKDFSSLVLVHEFDIVAVTETWLNEDIDSSILKINGYNLIRSDRSSGRGGGVAIYMRSTPLYMAPELIDELPYDYNADLWSLGCIIYELLMGTPPFCTNSILHLIRMIKHEQIQWPTFLSPDCTSFLKGLLQKNPARRLTWEQILNHPFVKGHVLVCKSTASMPLTVPLTASTQEVKEQQRKDSINNKHLKGAIPKCTNSETDNQKASSTNSDKTKDDKQRKSDNLENNSTNAGSGQNSTGARRKEPKKFQEEKSSKEKLEKGSKEKIEGKIKTDKKDIKNESVEVKTESSKCSKQEEILSKCLKEKLNFIEDSHPIEPEEWIVFLQRSIQEVISGEMSSLVQPNLTNIIVSPLRNSNSNSKVLSFVAKLLSIAFVVKGTSEETLEQIKKVYLEVKLLPNLIYASKLLLRKLKPDSSISSSTSKSNSSSEAPVLKPKCVDSYKSLDALEAEDLDALENLFMLACHLVHLKDDFLMQFCDAIVILNVYGLINMFLGLAKRKIRISMDILSILTHTIRRLPENTEIIEKIVLNDANASESQVHLGDFLRNSNPAMRERTCHFVLLMGKYFQHSSLEKLWTVEIRDTLEALMFDSIESVRNAAEATVGELKHKEFYIKSSKTF